MHRAGQQPLEQLALPEHDHRFVANALRQVVGALDGLRRAHEPDEQRRAPREQRSRDNEQRCERDGAGKRRYSRAFLSSAEIAGTISCRLPTTA